MCCTDMLSLVHHVDCLDSSACKKWQVVNSRRQHKLRPAEFAEARMPFRGLFLPSHLLPSNLRPLLISSCGDHKWNAVSLLQVLMLRQAYPGNKLHCIASFKPRPSTCERMNRCPSAFQNTTTRLSTTLLPSYCLGRTYVYTWTIEDAKSREVWIVYLPST